MISMLAFSRLYHTTLVAVYILWRRVSNKVQHGKRIIKVLHFRQFFLSEKQELRRKNVVIIGVQDDKNENNKHTYAHAVAVIKKIRVDVSG